MREIQEKLILFECKVGVSQGLSYRDSTVFREENKSADVIKLCGFSILFALEF